MTALQAIRGLLLLGAGLCMGFGAILWLRPALAQEINRCCSRWISTRPLEKAINRQYRIERLVFRHHRLFGGLMLAGAGYWLGWAWQQDHARHARALALAVGVHPDVAALFWDSFLITVSLVGLLAVLIGFVLLIRPSTLRRAEQWANRWIDVERRFQRLDVARYSLDQFLFRNARRVALAQMLGSCIMLWLLCHLGDVP